jgi:hypothetical protein
MARKPKNDDIGEIRCPFTDELAPVRRDCNGKLYYVGKAGMIKPNMPTGQDWMLENSVIWLHGKRPQAANDDAPPVTRTESETSPAANIAKPLTGAGTDILAPKPKIAPPVPVNESAPQKPVNEAHSTPQPKQSFTKWLIG